MGKFSLAVTRFTNRAVHAIKTCQWPSPVGGESSTETAGFNLIPGRVKPKNVKSNIHSLSALVFSIKKDNMNTSSSVLGRLAGGSLNRKLQVYFAAFWATKLGKKRSLQLYVPLEHVISIRRQAHLQATKRFLGKSSLIQTSVFRVFRTIELIPFLFRHKADIDFKTLYCSIWILFLVEM